MCLAQSIATMVPSTGEISHSLNYFMANSFSSTLSHDFYQVMIGSQSMSLHGIKNQILTSIKISKSNSEVKRPILKPDISIQPFFCSIQDVKKTLNDQQRKDFIDRLDKEVWNFESDLKQKLCPVLTLFGQVEVIDLTKTYPPPYRSNHPILLPLTHRE